MSDKTGYKEKMERAFYRSLNQNPEDSLDDILIFENETWCFRYERGKDKEEPSRIIWASTDEADEFLIENGIQPE